MTHSKGTARVHSSSIEIRVINFDSLIYWNRDKYSMPHAYSRLLIYCQTAAFAITHVISCSASSPIRPVNHRELATLARVAQKLLLYSNNFRVYLISKLQSVSDFKAIGKLLGNKLEDSILKNSENFHFIKILLKQFEINQIFIDRYNFKYVLY